MKSQKAFESSILNFILKRWLEGRTIKMKWKKKTKGNQTEKNTVGRKNERKEEKSNANFQVILLILHIKAFGILKDFESLC